MPGRDKETKRKGNQTQLFSRRRGATLIGVKRRLFKILVLLWFGWYLSGPVAELIDSWDPPREEMHDVMRNAGGLTTLLVVGVCFGLAAFGKFRECCKYFARRIGRRLSFLILELPTFLSVTVPVPTHSPPIPLRI